MNKNEIIINKIPAKNIFEIKSFSKNKNSFKLKFSIDANPKIIYSISEILRFLQSIDEKKFSFTLKTGFINRSDIPVITLAPENEKKQKLPAVIFLHGFETSKEKVLRYGMHFAGAGFFTLLVDLPDHGERTTADFEEKYNYKNEMLRSWFNRLLLFKKALEEIKLIIDYCLINSSVDKNRLAISGISMGGTLSLLAAYNDPRIKAVASFLSVFGYDTLPGLTAGNSIPEDKIEFIKSLDPLYSITKKPEAAILAQFGMKDEISDRPALTDFEKTLAKYFSSTPERFKLINHPGVSHDVNIEMIRNAVNWFKTFI